MCSNCMDTVEAPLRHFGSEACRTHVVLHPEDTASGLLLEQAEARVSAGEALFARTAVLLSELDGVIQKLSSRAPGDTPRLPPPPKTYKTL